MKVMIREYGWNGLWHQVMTHCHKVPGQRSCQPSNSPTVFRLTSCKKKQHRCDCQTSCESICALECMNQKMPSLITNGGLNCTGLMSSVGSIQSLPLMYHGIVHVHQSSVDIRSTHTFCLKSSKPEKEPNGW